MDHNNVQQIEKTFKDGTTIWVNQVSYSKSSLPSWVDDSQSDDKEVIDKRYDELVSRAVLDTHIVKSTLSEV